MKYSLVLALPLLLCMSQSADAHLRLTSHQARYGDSQKAGPCGIANGERTTDKVYIAKPGTQVMLVWDEFINHPSFFRIDFDLDGDDGFTNPILPCGGLQNSVADCFDTTNTGPYMVNNITDETAAVQNYLYTLPNVECQNCTLQVVQAMHDKPPFTDPGNEMYYQCVDIVLDNNGPDVLTLVTPGELPDAGPTAEPDAGASNADGGTTNPASDSGVNPGKPSVAGGCQSSTSTQGFGLALAALFFLRKRKPTQLARRPRAS